MKEIIYRFKENKVLFILFLTLLIIIILAIAGGFYYLKFKIVPAKEIVIESPPILSKEECVVEIKGKVINPGIYKVEEDSRVIDVINQAGGLTEDGDISNINLSKKIVDEMVIRIYSKTELSNYLMVKREEQLLNKKCLEDSYDLNNNACINDIEESTSLININTCTKEELMLLPSIGEAKANSIITYRNEIGLFKTIEDLKQVSGIGESIYAQIKSLITT